MSTVNIVLKDITVRYGEKTVLEHVNLRVEDHDYLGIIGPNGGGKTTLVKVILGMMKPAEGEVLYFRDGKQVKNLTMGYLPQYNNIDRKFPISVYDVVLSGLTDQKCWFRPFTRQQRQQVEDTIDRMELRGLEHRHIGALSGGQLQRALLARAVVSCPEVLILDEPNTYVDKKFQEQMYQMLTDINSLCTLIVVTHDVASILPSAKHFACVNHKLHCHQAGEVPVEKLEQHLSEI
ncbi:MAG: metal ABC transporter ATP-binding protein [Prevotella sp.]|jgi:zinc transport system ATP-binding protein